MSSLLEYKCAHCGGAIKFESSLQKLKCPFCDTEFEVESLKALDEELNNARPDEMHWESKVGSEWSESETDDLRSYVCNSCGGEIVADKNTAATSCPFCDNPIVMSGQFKGLLKPDYVIPFKLDKKAVKEGLLGHTQKKRLLPKIFKDENHIDEIKGVYVPFWLFDSDVDADIRYRATRLRSWSDSNFRYTETSFYSVNRSGNIGFEYVPVDGSSKIANDLMESIEPFSFNDAMDFQTAYLAGFLADKYDVSAEESISRANERIKNSTEMAFARTVNGYASVTPESSSIKLINGKVKYVLYPVWLLNTTWEEKKYTFAMNGQTGKFVGDLPLDKKAYWKWWSALTAIVSTLSVVTISLLNNV